MINKQFFKLGMFTWWLPLLAGLLITFIAAQALHHQNSMDINTYTNHLADSVENSIIKRFKAFENGLRAGRGAVAAVGVNTITQQQFANYINSRNIKQEYPGAMGFGFIRRVAPSEESNFIASSSTNRYKLLPCSTPLMMLLAYIRAIQSACSS